VRIVVPVISVLDECRFLRITVLALFEAAVLGADGDVVGFVLKLGVRLMNQFSVKCVQPTDKDNSCCWGTADRTALTIE